jgi:predicted metalloprotease with PDZ domain
MRRSAALLLLLLLAAIPASADEAQYTVTIAADPIRVSVRAALPAGDGRLLMQTGGGIDHLPSQWATFVRALRVNSGSVTSVGAEGWRVSGARGPLEVTYEVDLDYARKDWPAGNEQAGKLFEQALYTVTRPLFVYTTGVDRAVVRFEVPEGWQVAAPWTQRAPNEFAARSVADLAVNSFVAGRYESASTEVAGLQVVAALPGASAAAARHTSRVVEQVAAVARRLFEAKEPQPYLFTIFHAPQEDGEAFTSSAALTTPWNLEEGDGFVWVNTLAHELLHHWIGHRIRGADDSMQWFTEGFTEYYANVAVSRANVVSREHVRQKIAFQLGGYLLSTASSLYDDVTMVSAGKQKGRYRFAVYDAGWVLAFGMDAEIRKATNGEKSLDDLIRLLDTKYGATSTPVTTASIVTAASEIGGTDLGVFRAYVEEGARMPVERWLSWLGCDIEIQDYAGQAYVHRQRAPLPSHATMRAVLFGPQGR